MVKKYVYHEIYQLFISIRIFVYHDTHFCLPRYVLFCVHLARQCTFDSCRNSRECARFFGRGPTCFFHPYLVHIINVRHQHLQGAVPRILAKTHVFPSIPRQCKLNIRHTCITKLSVSFAIFQQQRYVIHAASHLLDLALCSRFRINFYLDTNLNRYVKCSSTESATY